MSEAEVLEKVELNSNDFWTLFTAAIMQLAVGTFIACNNPGLKARCGSLLVQQQCNLTPPQLLAGINSRAIGWI